MPNHYPNLNPEKALIWRIVHRDNLPWILDNGLHCSNDAVLSQNWVNIGNEELIDRRSHRIVPIIPGGSLGEIDWPILKARNFQRSADDPDKIERYQAEALIYKHLPVSSLVGVVCYTDELKLKLEADVSHRGLNLAVHKLTGWYF